MKFILTAILILTSCNLFAQNFQGPEIYQPVREAIFFIDDLNDVNDAVNLENYLSKFEGKIKSVNINLATQMCIMEVKIIDDQNLEELIYQAGFKGFLKSELPPEGFKFIYNPDGTWKTVEI